MSLVVGLRRVLPGRGENCAKRGAVPALAVVIPMLALAAYLAVVIIRLPSFYLAEVAWNSDATSYMLLSKTLAQDTHGAIYLSYAPWYSTILIDVLTYHLPDHRAIWIAWPLCAYVVAVGLLAVTVTRLAGRWAALMTAILCLAITPPMLQTLLAQAFHGLTTINCILLAAFLVYLVEAGAETTRLTLLAAVGLGVLTGVNAVSDLLLVVIGIVPLTGVALALLAKYRDRASTRAAVLWLGMIVIAFIAGFTTVAAANSLGLVPRTVLTRLVRPSEIIPHVELAGGVVWEEVGSTWPYAANEVSLRQLLVGVAVLGAIALAIVILAIRLLRSCPTKSSAESRRMEAHYLSWTAIAAADFAALTFTIAPIDLGAIRYATALWVAAAATLPLFFTRSRPRQIGFALLVTGLVAVHTGLVNSAQGTPDRNLAAVVAYLESQHIRHGYADYWEANGVTWATNGVLTLRPATSCNTRGTLCAFEFANASTWYAPQPGWSAVIVDPRNTLSIAPASVYGPPREVRHVGQVTVYIFDHDVGPVTMEPWPY